MCVVSMIADHYIDRWKPLVPIDPVPVNPYQPLIIQVPSQPQITDEEIKEFRRLLDRAREYDKQHGQEGCELEEKKKKLLELAEQLGIKDKVKFLDDEE